MSLGQAGLTLGFGICLRVRGPVWLCAGSVGSRPWVTCWAVPATQWPHPISPLFTVLLRLHPHPPQSTLGTIGPCRAASLPPQ